MTTIYDKMKIFSIWLLLLSSSSLSCSSAAMDPVTQFVACLSSIPKDRNFSSIPPDQIYQRKDAAQKFTTALDEYVRNLRYNTSATRKPAVIVTVKNETQVPTAVDCANRNGIELRIRSGGHDYEGLSYVSNFTSQFAILDMFHLNSTEVDIPSESAWVQAGATLGELYYRIYEKSRVHGFPAGVCPTVGVGGHLSGAGYGNMLRHYGLSVDHVVDARIVNVKGKILDRAGMGEDLFWAIRGGGGASFGVILAFKIKLVQVPEKVTYFRVEKMGPQSSTAVVSDYQKAVQTMDSRLFVRLLLQPVSVTQNKITSKTVRVTAIALFLGNTADLKNIAGHAFPSLQLKPNDFVEMTWIQSVLLWANFNYTGDPKELLNRNPIKLKFDKRKSDYVITPIPRDGLESLWKKQVELENVGLVFNSYGGKLTKTSDDATPFPHRAGILFKIQYSISWDSDTDTKLNLDRTRQLHNFMTEYVTKNPRQAYLNYRDLDIGVSGNGGNTYEQAKVYGQMYFNKNFERLVKVKTAVDPKNFFRNEQSIPLLPGKLSRKERTGF